MRDLIQDFHMAVDDYLQLCAERGTEPEKSIVGIYGKGIGIITLLK